MSKILVNLNVPTIGRKYNIWILPNQRISDVINLLVKGIDELNEGYYKPDYMPILYNKNTGRELNLNNTVRESNIKNGSEIVLI